MGADRRLVVSRGGVRLHRRADRSREVYQYSVATDNADLKVYKYIVCCRGTDDLLEGNLAAQYIILWKRSMRELDDG